VNDSQHAMSRSRSLSSDSGDDGEEKEQVASWSSSDDAEPKPSQGATSRKQRQTEIHADKTSRNVEPGQRDTRQPSSRGVSALPTSHKKVLAVDSQDAAALILQMRRKMKQTAPQPSSSLGTARGQSVTQLKLSTSSAAAIRQFQEEALRSLRSKSPNSEQDFYRNLIEKDVLKRTALGAGKKSTSPGAKLAIARGLSSGPKATAHGRSRTESAPDNGPRQRSPLRRTTTPGPLSKRSMTDTAVRHDSEKAEVRQAS